MRRVKRCAVPRKESGRGEANGLRRKELEVPFPVSPPGQAGAGGFPPRREHAARQPKRRHASMHPAPPTRGLPPPYSYSVMGCLREAYSSRRRSAGCGNLLATTLIALNN